MSPPRPAPPELYERRQLSPATLLVGLQSRADLPLPACFFRYVLVRLWGYRPTKVCTQAEDKDRMGLGRNLGGTWSYDCMCHTAHTTTTGWLHRHCLVPIVQHVLLDLMCT